MPSVDQVPTGYELRDATAEDAPAIAELINEVCLAEVGVPWTTVEQTRDALTSPGRDPLFPDAVLFARDGEVIGYLEFDVTADPLQVEILAFVRPRLSGRGLNAWLLAVGEERARARVERERPREPTPLRVACFTGNEPARRLFTALGFRNVRTFWMMRVELDVAPPTPAVPRGIGIRTFEVGDEARVHAALADGFADHWGNVFPEFDAWRHLEIEGEGSAFDPSLWFLATEGDQIVGAATCQASTPRAEGTAQVGELAVRRPWRRRGIALALLHTAFAEFHRRGIPRAELGVDAENPTGATHLYERAGMHEVYSWEIWQKELGH